MIQRLLIPALATALFWTLWWAVAASSGTELLPTPWQTAKAFIAILSAASSWHHIATTTWRVFTGTLLGSVAGLLLGLATRYSSILRAAVYTVIHPLLASIPTICWALLFVLWFGLADATPVLVIATAVAPFFLINIREGLQELDDNLEEMATLYTRRLLPILTRIILPMLYPYLFTATRSAFMIAWKVVILGEIFGAASGMGYMLAIAFESYRIADVFGWTLAFAAILLFFDHGVFNCLDRWYMRRWKYIALKS